MSGRRVNATGRSTPRIKNKHAKYPDTIGWVGRQRDMLESPAFAALDKTEHRVLARLEVEFIKHSGIGNGDLPCTYADFEGFGIDGGLAAKAIRVLEALGFIRKISDSAGNAGEREPNKFRLTYLWTNHGSATHEWRKIKTKEEALNAKKAAVGARLERRAPAIRRKKSEVAQAI